MLCWNCWNHPEPPLCLKDVASPFGIIDALATLMAFVNQEKIYSSNKLKICKIYKMVTWKTQTAPFLPDSLYFFTQSYISWANEWTIIKLYSKWFCSFHSLKSSTPILDWCQGEVSHSRLLSQFSFCFYVFSNCSAVCILGYNF